jgi:ACS family glucarate transporter-like MFS transporter
LIAYIIYYYGWRLSLWTCAFIGLLIGVLWFLMARDEPEHHPWVSPAEVSLISSGLPDATKSAESQLMPWRTILGCKDVWVVTASYFGFVYVAYIFFTWF